MTSMNKHSDPGYVGYEYREITVPRELASLCLDSYPCFGWERDPNREAGRGPSAQSRPRPGVSGRKETETLYFRRKRTLCNKTELTRLQRNFDSCVNELQALERAKTSSAAAAALAMGVIGCAFLAGSTFAVVADPPIIWLTILLAVPGFLCWIFPYFLYQKLARKKTAEIRLLQEQKYDEIEAVCQKGHSLLY